MNYHKYFPVDVVNGPGTRCTLFVSGCIHQCRGCYNKTTWKLSSGHLFDEKMADRVIADLSDKRIRRRGLSLSGGDPLHPENVEAVLQLVQRIREECPGKDIWLWTGFVLAELSTEQQQLVELVDAVVDGKFEKELADANLIWRGSSNQIIYRNTEQGFVVADDWMNQHLSA